MEKIKQKLIDDIKAFYNKKVSEITQADTFDWHLDLGDGIECSISGISDVSEEYSVGDTWYGLEEKVSETVLNGVVVHDFAIYIDGYNDNELSDDVYSKIFVST